MAQFTTRLRVAVLLDRDTSDDRPMTDGRGTYYLPVSMIENLLLDPDAIWEAIQSVVEKTKLSRIEDISIALDALLEAMENEESDRRVLGRLGADVFRPEGPSSTFEQQIDTFSRQLITKYAPSDIAILKVEADAVVARLKVEKKRREFFHGKDVLARLFKLHLHQAGLPKNVFLFETARHARRRRSVTEFFDRLFAELLPEVAPAKVAPEPAPAKEA